MSYKIYIVKESDEISCDLICNNKKYPFDIQNVLGDFMDIRHFIKTKDGKRKIGYDYENHIFTKGKDLELIEYEAIKTGQDFSGCKIAFNFLKKAQKLLNNPKGSLNVRMARLTELQNYYGLNFKSQISVKDFVGTAETTYDEKPKNLKGIKKKDTWFTYNCDTVGDVVAAIVHYYLLHNYKLISCKHCGRIFATSTLKQEYCKNRISPFEKKNRKNLDCENAVRWEIQCLKVNKKRIDNKIYQSVNYQLGKLEFCFQFRDKCIEFEEIIKDAPTPENLKRYSDYLEDVNQEGAWIK